MTTKLPGAGGREKFREGGTFRGGGAELAIAGKLADAAMMHLRRSQELARVAMKVRTGEA